MKHTKNMNKVTLLLKISHNAIYYTTSKHKLAPLFSVYTFVQTQSHSTYWKQPIYHPIEELKEDFWIFDVSHDVS